MEIWKWLFCLLFVYLSNLFKTTWDALQTLFLKVECFLWKWLLENQRDSWFKFWSYWERILGLTRFLWHTIRANVRHRGKLKIFWTWKIIQSGFMVNQVPTDLLKFEFVKVFQRFYAFLGFWGRKHFAKAFFAKLEIFEIDFW